MEAHAEYRVKAVMQFMTVSKVNLSQKLQAQKRECERLQKQLDGNVYSR